MQKSIEKFSYKDIAFVESGIIATNGNKKDEICFISHMIHIIGFRAKDTSVVVCCLDYGLSTHGKNEEEAKSRILEVVEYFLVHNTEKVINKILSSPTVEEYWGLYRLYSKKHTPKKVKRMYQEQRHDISLEEYEKKYATLQEEYQKMSTKLQEQDRVIRFLLSENQQLQSQRESKNSKNSEKVTYIPMDNKNHVVWLPKS